MNRLLLAACLASCILLQACIGPLDSLRQGDPALEDCDSGAATILASACASG